MKATERVAAALSSDGAWEIPVVIPYEDILIRDHWSQLTGSPWWHIHSPDLAHQVDWRVKVARRIGQDWFALPGFYSKAQRDRFRLQLRPAGVFRVDRVTGAATRLAPPRVGGEHIADRAHASAPVLPADSVEALDRLIPSPEAEPASSLADGAADLALALRQQLDLYPIKHVPSPLWSTWQLWGFEGMMTRIAQRPDLVKHACARYLALSLHQVETAALWGARGVWIEECMTDMIGPQAFATLNLPFLRELVEAIRARGLCSIYYYCGNPAGKWEQLLGAGADALALEEGKKGFVIDIEDVVDRVRGRCAVLGNLDAIHLLPHGSEEDLRRELARQMAAGRRNGSRFIMSLGSPVTPGTSVERVRLYCDLAHSLGQG